VNRFKSGFDRSLEYAKSKEPDDKVKQGWAAYHFLLGYFHVELSK
jgi:hypothetical protein